MPLYEAFAKNITYYIFCVMSDHLKYTQHHAHLWWHSEKYPKIFKGGLSPLYGSWVPVRGRFSSVIWNIKYSSNLEGESDSQKTFNSGRCMVGVWG